MEKHLPFKINGVDSYVSTYKTSSGRWLAWVKDREDIIANGETEEEVKVNLEKMHKAVIEYESKSCA